MISKSKRVVTVNINNPQVSLRLQPSTEQTSTFSALPSHEYFYTHLSLYFVSRGHSSHFGYFCAHIPNLFKVIIFTVFHEPVFLVKLRNSSFTQKLFVLVFIVQNLSISVSAPPFS
jgi:cellulose synthase/poly-beta-1,6-N-acetylglucosamine synthase-like glycosyltransferase